MSQLGDGKVLNWWKGQSNGFEACEGLVLTSTGIIASAQKTVAAHSLCPSS